MGHRRVSNGKLSQIVSNHFRLDLHIIKDLSIVDSNDRSNHLGDNDHVPEVGLDCRGLFIGQSLFLGLAKLLDEAHRLALEATGEASTGPGVQELNKLFVRHVQQLLEFQAAEGEDAECSFFGNFFASLARRS